MSDFQTYERLESMGEDFAYVLVTNEFDAARLRAACERRRQMRRYSPMSFILTRPQ
jgi:hypothetical protein